MTSILLAGLAGMIFSAAFGMMAGYGFGRRIRLARIRRLRQERDWARSSAEMQGRGRDADAEYHAKLVRVWQERCGRAEDAILDAGMVIVEDVGGEVRLMYQTEAPQF